MLEYDMLSGAFLDEDTSAPSDVEHAHRLGEPWPELRLLSVEESEVERSGR